MGEDARKCSLCTEPQLLGKIPKLPPGWKWSPESLCDTESVLAVSRPVINNGWEDG